MTDYILIDGDIANFMPNFGAAVVAPQPGTLQGSGPATLNGANVCVEGDEQNVEVPGCVYIAGQYCIPGTGTLKIDSLAGDQVATKTQTGGTAVMLKGSQFNAKFEVQSPAQQPPPGLGSPIPDSSTEYAGQGSFITANTKFQGT